MKELQIDYINSALLQGAFKQRTWLQERTLFTEPSIQESLRHPVLPEPRAGLCGTEYVVQAAA
jgi:hypothetical protein